MANKLAEFGNGLDDFTDVSTDDFEDMVNVRGDREGDYLADVYIVTWKDETETKKAVLKLTGCGHLFKEIKEAYACLERYGVIHNDLRPENVIVTQTDEVKIIDFNLAEFIDEDGGDGDDEQTS
ncbi:protein kinase domain protein [Gregarina niphandrodes]|uniref:Protein kinase domain protein n=1 Tax=Gregarina niphandrodes TaxID=110365 RepID=A0A023B208_GRENI|nr:protein kinase domain protein [Gregarina niphandrodes]EZG49272.1 protein kinase domain protein [Gregarina niphandrodes]|eukprot:XP_011132056.1 protein kinase domain protein [Gregarina niphandrodes]